MLVTILCALVGLVILGILVVGLYIAIQGKEEIRLLVEKRTKAVLASKTPERVDFTVEVPFDNIGKVEACMLDAYMRIYLPQEQYADVLLRGKVNLQAVPREDDYFEAYLVPAGLKNTLSLRFEAYAKNGKTIEEALANIPDVDVALFVDCRGREDLYTIKRYLTLSAEEMRSLVK